MTFTYILPLIPWFPPSKCKARSARTSPCLALIVSREKEMLRMIKGIEEIKGDRFTQNEIKLLSSKIISAEQIAKGF